MTEEKQRETVVVAFKASAVFTWHDTNSRLTLSNAKRIEEFNSVQARINDERMFDRQRALSGRGDNLEIFRTLDHESIAVPGDGGRRRADEFDADNHFRTLCDKRDDKRVDCKRARTNLSISRVAMVW